MCVCECSCETHTHTHTHTQNCSWILVSFIFFEITWAQGSKFQKCFEVIFPCPCLIFCSDLWLCPSPPAPAAIGWAAGPLVMPPRPQRPLWQAGIDGPSGGEPAELLQKPGGQHTHTRIQTHTRRRTHTHTYTHTHTHTHIYTLTRTHTYTTYDFGDCVIQI